MGRKTFDSLPGPLPGRRHIVLTRAADWRAEARKWRTRSTRRSRWPGPGDIAVIGGDEIFELFLPLATGIELTEVHEDTAGRRFMPRARARMARDRARGAPGRGWRPGLRLRDAGTRLARLMRFGHRDPVPQALRGAVIALGNFDGFHSGTRRWSPRRSRGRGPRRPVIVATFDPHPVRHFAPHVPWFRLTGSTSARTCSPRRGRRDAGVRVRRRPRGDHRRGLRRRLLGGHLGAAGVVTGEDFTFGKGRGGNVALLAEEGARHGIAARTVGPVSEGGLPVSSSRVRDALKAGECEAATRLMTRPFAIRGVGAARRQARADDRLSDGEPRHRAITCARGTASMR